MKAFAFLLLAFLLTACTMKPTDNSDQTFPGSFSYANPYGLEDLPTSTFISNVAALEDDIVPEIPANYTHFFRNRVSILSDLAQSVSNESFSRFLDSLQTGPLLLECHGFNEYISGPAHLFNFTDANSFTEWKENWPCYGISLELVDPTEIPAELPTALQEVYQLGRLYLFGFPGSGFFFHPREIRPALEVEYLGEYMLEFDADTSQIPIAQLKPFYTDSGCWLMYDHEGTVYCGGVECGDFYNSGLKMEAVISNIFSQLLSGDTRMSIESFAPKPKP